MGATWDQFARALLGALGAPVTADNEAAMLTWFVHEQPPNSPNGAYNPLNIQNDDFAGLGYTKTGHGQWNFPDFTTGVQAVTRELNTRLYAPVKAALMQGNNPVGVLDAVQSSPWAAGHYGGHLASDYSPANLSKYAGGQVAGAGGATAVPPGAGGPADAGGAGGAQQVGLFSDVLGGIWNALTSPFAAVGSAVGKDVARIVLTGTFVMGGVALVVVGLYRSVAPAVRETTQEAGNRAGQAAGAIGAARGAGAAGGDAAAAAAL